MITFKIILPILIFGFLFFPTIEANGSVKNYQENQIDEFLIGLGSVPDQPTKGLNHFALYLTDAKSNEKFQNLIVYFSAYMENHDNSEVVKYEMKNTLFDPEYYEIDVSLDTVGKWFLLVEIEINENQLDVQTFSTVFEINVESPNPLNSFLTLGLLGFLIIILIRSSYKLLLRKSK